MRRLYPAQAAAESRRAGVGHLREAEGLLLALAHRGPSTVAKLASDVGCSERRAGQALRALRRLGLVRHVDGLWCRS